MTLEDLLQECETLTHHGRMYRMVELGLLAVQDASMRELIAALARGNIYERTLALQSYYGSQNSALALQALSDPSRCVRSLALPLVSILCSDTEIQAALDTISNDLQVIILTNLARRRRQEPINMYIEALAARQDARLKRLLPFASLDIVTHHLGQVIDKFELDDWKRLTRSHPAFASTQLRARITASDVLDQQFILQVNAVMPLLAQLDPDAGLELVRGALTLIPFQRLSIQSLVLRRPREIFDLLRHSGQQSSINFSRAIPILDTEQIIALFTHYATNFGSHHFFHKYFRKLKPEQRLEIYTACARGWRDKDGILPLDIIKSLPTVQRMQEAHRHIALPALATSPISRLRYAAFLPWDEAQELVSSYLNTPDADLRAAALSALIASARYQRERLSNVLQLVRVRRYEQDPVRLALLNALSELPRHIWSSADLDNLEQIILDALNARDLSAATANTLERIVLQLFSFHPTWCSTQLTNLYRKRGYTSVTKLYTYISKAHTQLFADTLLPLIKEWKGREREAALVSLANAFGPRLRVMSELADILESLLSQTRQASTINTALELFAEYQRPRLSSLIPRLLEQDKSCITLTSVSAYLHRNRQDLLTPFLGQQAYQGRFSTGKTRYVLSFSEGFYRWTPTQQELFALTLLEVANDEKRPTSSLTYTIHQLAAMPALDPAYLIPFASDTREPVRDTALQVLGKLDAGQGIPILLEALNDARARVAIYALRKALLSLPQAEALKILRGVPTTQVTVAKETIRLIGELATEEAYRELLTLNTHELHRDVRVALLRAFWSYLERDETWEIFNQAAHASDISIARGVIQIPADGLSPQAQKRLATLLATLLNHPDPTVRMHVLQRCMHHPVTDTEHTLLTHLSALLNSPLPGECALASRAFFAIYMGRDANLVGEAIRQLLNNRQALYVAYNNYLPTLHNDQRRLVPTTRAILSALASDRLTISMRLNLIIQGLPWSEVAPEIMRLAKDLHPDALARAIQAIEGVAKRPDIDLATLEQALANSRDERLRRLALAALITQGRQASGWTDERIKRLERYKADLSPLVAETAQFTFVS
ncbi:HEAT repeat domain-containing protein [Ktedonobacter robiniae]|uniref:HEAT repeat domain-containing protein n=1 Tax=Ktedonobacter robiniae TaxID=2778365 RepID=A0ABQ3V2C8_9CHLR|nr:hypothetical protein [Ktedonobacter robiniae]GHO59321.1 hypothetical protein KSB_77960 [Ktedonobacter robiniae]